MRFANLPTNHGWAAGANAGHCETAVMNTVTFVRASLRPARHPASTDRAALGSSGSAAPA